MGLSTLEAPSSEYRRQVQVQYSSQRDRCRVYIHANLHVHILERHTYIYMSNKHMYMTKITQRTSIQHQGTNYAGAIRAKYPTLPHRPETEGDQTAGVVSSPWAC